MLVRHDLGEEAKDYVRSYLEANGAFGKLLGPLLLQAHEIDGGVAWAFVPNPLPPERVAPLTNFEDGPLYKHAAWRKRVDTWLDDTREAAPGSWLLCVEDGLGKPSDPFVAKRNDPKFFCRDSIYWFETADEAEDRTRIELGGAVWEPNVGIVSVMPASAGRLDRQTLEDSALAELAASVTAIVIGAWDREGLIFWEPSTAARR
jgi:hypothetical protein